MKGLPRLKELIEGIGRIREKIVIAEEMGVDSAVIAGSSLSLDALNNMLESLAKDEAGRIRDSKGPKIPAGPGDLDGDDKGNNPGGVPGAPVHQGHRARLVHRGRQEQAEAVPEDLQTQFAFTAAAKNPSGPGIAASKPGSSSPTGLKS